MAFFSVAGETPKQPDKVRKAISPGTLIGMGLKQAKPQKPVAPFAVKAVSQTVQTPKRQIVTPFQATPVAKNPTRPIFCVSTTSKPDFNVCLGQFIPSEAELMSLKSRENANEL